MAGRGSNSGKGRSQLLQTDVCATYPPIRVARYRKRTHVSGRAILRLIWRKRWTIARYFRRPVTIGTRSDIGQAIRRICVDGCCAGSVAGDRLRRRERSSAACAACGPGHGHRPDCATSTRSVRRHLSDQPEPCPARRSPGSLTEPSARLSPASRDQHKSFARSTLGIECATKSAPRRGSL